MPLKQVEVISLGGDDDDDHEKEGVLVETPLICGSFVEAGDVVGIISVAGGADSTTTNKQYEVLAPATGRLVEIHAKVNSAIKVGDPLVTIDTDAVIGGVPSSATTTTTTINTSTNTTSQQNQQSIIPEIAALVDHLKQHQGQLQDDYIQELCQSIDKVETLRALASFLSDDHPSGTPSLSADVRVKALPLLERVLELQLERDPSLTNDPHHVQEQAKTHTDLGILLYRLGDLDAALTQLECALELRKVALGESHPELSATLIHMGAIQHQKNDLDGCWESFHAALEIQKEHLGEKHPLVAASLNNIGAIHYHKKEFAKSIPYYQQALEIYQQQQQQEVTATTAATEQYNISSDIAGTYNNLAVAMKHTGDYKMALDYSRKALQLRKDVLGTNHIDTATSHYCLGQLFAELRHYDAAQEQFEAAYTVQCEHYGNTGNHPACANTRNNIGALYYEQGLFDKALVEYQRGLDAFSAALGNAAPQVADCWNNVGMAQLRLGDFNAALTSHEQAKSILQNHFGDDHPTLAMTLASIGTVYKNQRQYDQALEYYRKSHQMLEQAVGPEHDMVGSSYNNMGQVLALQGKLEDALTVYRAALVIFQKALSKDHVFTGSIHYNIGLVLQQLVGDDGDGDDQNEKEQALEEYQHALRIWTDALGPEHPQTRLAELAIDQINLISSLSDAAASSATTSTTTTTDSGDQADPPKNT